MSVIRHPRVTAATALGLVVCGVLAVVDIGGLVADIVGLATVVVALSLLSRAAFRVAEDPSRTSLAERARPTRLR